MMNPIRTHMTSVGPGVVFLILALAGCRGTSSSKPPIHISPNMDMQEKFEAQERNAFFADERAMRPPVQGTVARGGLREDTKYYTGRAGNGTYITQNPVQIDAAFMERGRGRYEIFCSVCHGSAGDGQGIIMTGNYGYVPAPTYHSDALRALTDGYLYEVITNGVRTMPSYAQQIRVRDRWAIVAYIRALQRSQYASVSDVPETER